MANAAAYTDMKDGHANLTKDDWYCKHGDTFAVLIESYSTTRGGLPGRLQAFRFLPTGRSAARLRGQAQCFRCCGLVRRLEPVRGLT
jgi:hypothetical protein